MSLTPPPAQAPSADTAVSGLPFAAVIAGIRRTLIWTIVAGLVYATFMTGSKGLCPGGVDANGGFIDADGRSVDQAPLCVSLTLRPSVFVYVGIALIVLIAIGRVAKASDERAALRTLERAIQGAGLLVAIALVVSHVWFQLTPLEHFSSGSWSYFSPFPLGVIDVVTEPMTGS
ncbi:hypothetical protein [Microbacterium sp. NPDC055665]